MTVPKGCSPALHKIVGQTESRDSLGIGDSAVGRISVPRPERMGYGRDRSLGGFSLQLLHHLFDLFSRPLPELDDLCIVSVLRRNH